MVPARSEPQNEPRFGGAPGLSELHLAVILVDFWRLLPKLGPKRDGNGHRVRKRGEYEKV